MEGNENWLAARRVEDQLEDIHCRVLVIESFPFISPDQLERSIRSQQLSTNSHAHLKRGHSLRLELMEAARLNVLFTLLWLEAWSASRPQLVPVFGEFGVQRNSPCTGPGSDNDTHVGVIFLTHRGHQRSIPGFPPTGLCLSDTACTSL